MSGGGETSRGEKWSLLRLGVCGGRGNEDISVTERGTRKSTAAAESGSIDLQLGSIPEHLPVSLSQTEQLGREAYYTPLCGWVTNGTIFSL